MRASIDETVANSLAELMRRPKRALETPIWLGKRRLHHRDSITKAKVRAGDRPPERNLRCDTSLP